MANALYTSFKEAALSGDIDLVSGTVNALLIDTDEYTFSAAHTALDDIPTAARVSAPQSLASKTVTGGVFDAADVTFPNVPAGDAVEAVVLYVSGGTEAGSPLIGYFDSAVSGLPVTPNTGDITINWHASGIFSI